MGTTKGFSFREVLKKHGARSVIVSLLVFVLTVTLTCVVGYQFYDTTKENIQLQGKVNAVHAAKEFDGYLLVRKNTVILAGHVVDEMMGEGKTNAEILDYLSAESLSIKKSIDKDYTGLYGWINGEYLDGDGWVPEDGYVPTERPWYLETIADDSEITFVRPYLDAQTKTVLTTVAVKLADGKSVIALDITLSRVQEIAEEIARQTVGSYGIVLDETGQVIAHSDDVQLGKNYLEETGTEIALEGKHLLIAEDQEINAEVLTDLLELEGMSSEWAENGKLAVELFAQSEQGHFDAILMDMRMPVMDGLSATREIRKLARPDAAAIPIIALSANAFEEDVKQCLEAGMNEHLSKPIDVDRLKETLGRLLG